MKLQIMRRVGLALFGVCLVLSASCQRVDARPPSETRVPQPTQLAPLVDVPPMFWWTSAGEMSAATVAFGAPFLDSAGTPRRPWALSAFRPGSGHPLVVFQSVVDLRGAEAIGCGAGEFRVQLLPLPGQTWADVTGAELLSATVEGVY